MLAHELFLDLKELLILNQVDIIGTLPLIDFSGNFFLGHLHLLDVSLGSLADLLHPGAVSPLQFHDESVFGIRELLLGPLKHRGKSVGRIVFFAAKGFGGTLDGRFQSLIPTIKFDLVGLEPGKLLLDLFGLLVVKCLFEFFFNRHTVFEGASLSIDPLVYEIEFSYFLVEVYLVHFEFESII